MNICFRLFCYTKKKKYKNINKGEKAMNKIIIDTDPGVDDALALLLAVAAELNVIGITTVYGNAAIDETTQNALSILDVLQSKIPVYKGCDCPLIRKPTLAHSHGEGGLGGFTKPNMKAVKENRNAIQFMIDTLEENDNDEVEIFCLGPTTNLALLKILRPDLIPKIYRILVLGGVFNASGNISRLAEFNVFNDPEALKIVLKFDTIVTIIPINDCRKVMFSEGDLDLIVNEAISKDFKTITKGYIDYYKNNEQFGNFQGGVMYDLLVIAYFMRPDLFQTKRRFVTVTSTGVTRFKPGRASNANVTFDVDAPALKKLFFSTVNDTK